MQQSPELKEKMQQIHESDLSSGSRLEDYLGNTGAVLSYRDVLLKGGKISVEDIGILEDEYKKIVETILKLPIQDLVVKLNDNKPSKTGTNPNIESIKRAFGIN